MLSTSSASAWRAATSAKLYGVVLRIVRRHELAAAVMADAYLEIWNTAGEFNPAQASPLAWMVAIARRLAIDVSRQSGAAEGEPEVIEEDEGPGTVPRHALSDALKRLLTCIGRLEPDRQRMLLLAYYGAFGREQLAVKLDMPVDLLKEALRRSLNEVEQCLNTQHRLPRRMSKRKRKAMKANPDRQSSRCNLSSAQRIINLIYVRACDPVTRGATRPLAA